MTLWRSTVTWLTYLVGPPRSGEPSQQDVILARFAGLILFAFGLGLVALSTGLVVRQLEFYRTVPAKALGMVSVFTLIAVFCIPVGFRLLFNRPNRYGSVLSPGGWFTLSSVFAILAFAQLYFAFDVASPLGLIGAILCAPFAYLCYLVGVAVRTRLTSAR